MYFRNHLLWLDETNFKNLNVQMSDGWFENRKASKYGNFQKKNHSNSGNFLTLENVYFKLSLRHTQLA